MTETQRLSDLTSLHDPSVDTPHRIGFIGAGNMGLPMIRRLLSNLADVLVRARTEEAAYRHRSAGIPASTTRAQVAAADTVIVCLSTQEQVSELLLGEGGMLHEMRPGALLIVHTTCSPTEFERVLTAAAERGIHVVDAPLEGVPTDFEAGNGKLYFAAQESVADRAQQVLRNYGGSLSYCGEPGFAQRTKVLNVLLTAANAHLLEAAVALAGALDLDVKSALSAVAAGGSSATSILEYSLQFGDQPVQFVDAIRPFLKKDVGNYAGLFAQLQAETGVLYDAAQRAAQGELAPDAAQSQSHLQQWARPA